jgi:NADH:ubiquinone oxidoreductase subunit
MGCDSAGNRYYENRIDYPAGQHRWVEPGDIHNFDSSQVQPEWHGWLTHQNDITPTQEAEYFEKMQPYVRTAEISNAPFKSHVGHQEPYFNFHHMHNQSQIRSRGYMIGNHVVGLPPGAPDAYYTQPGSPYNEASVRKFKTMGDLDAATKGGGRPYKNEMWKDRLTTTAEKEARKNLILQADQKLEGNKKKMLTAREAAILERGGRCALPFKVLTQNKLERFEQDEK